MRRVRTERPRFAFAALTGVDKTSHAEGHDATVVIEALRIVDATVAELRADAERDGRWATMQLWVVSDHGHSAVHSHEDLLAVVSEDGVRAIAHPWVYAINPDAAVMVSGNAMAHIYLDLREPRRPWWPALAPRWRSLADRLLSRPSVDLMLLPRSESRCEVHARGRGHAVIEHDEDLRRGTHRYAYRTVSGDPFDLGREVEGDRSAMLEATLDSDYPDAIVQIAHLAGAARSGEIILSASPGWDFRARYEPIPHVSSHGSLHRSHMLVPLLTNQVPRRTPQRTVDVMPSALAALDIPIPPGLDGEPFV